VGSTRSPVVLKGLQRLPNVRDGSPRPQSHWWAPPVMPLVSLVSHFFSTLFARLFMASLCFPANKLPPPFIPPLRLSTPSCPPLSSITALMQAPSGLIRYSSVRPFLLWSRCRRFLRLFEKVPKSFLFCVPPFRNPIFEELRPRGFPTSMS